MIRAAGILFHTDDGKVLLLRRSSASSEPGTWCVPGGGVEDGESAEQAARREALEECGWADPAAELSLWTRTEQTGVDFTTYLCRVPSQFPVTLNEEHSAYAWVPRAEIDQSFARVDALTDSDIDYVHQKMSKSAVDYGPGMPARHCGICEHFEAPESCAMVRGTISPSAWCEKFKA